ncbi:glycosyltransferase [bacterium]|nr:glycosyltransferase [bacterium]
MHDKKQTVSLVFPVFNEEACIHQLWQRLELFVPTIANYAVEIIMVDDGSTDRSFELLAQLAGQVPYLKVIRFSRNFGHQIAITAGVDRASGDVVVVMDADLQDPPELVLDMLTHYENGADVVYAVRRSRLGETPFKKKSATAFYRILNRLSNISIPHDTGDFRLMSRRVVDALGTLRESERFVRGLVSWVGFKQVPIYFDRDPRVAGDTKYPLRKMVTFALNGLVSFSTSPLRCASWVGFGLSVMAGVYICVVIGLWLTHHTFPGYASLMVAILMLGGIQLMTIGILGEYIGRMFMQTKNRPLYIVQDEVGF